MHSVCARTLHVSITELKRVVVLKQTGAADRLLSCLSCKGASNTLQSKRSLLRQLFFHCTRTCFPLLCCALVRMSAIAYASPVMRSQSAVLPLKF